MLKQTIKNSIIGGIVFSLTVMIFGLSYAAWTALSTETDGRTLTSTKWNAVINRLNSIDQARLTTAWVDFNGMTCTTNGNECTIKASYNINKVTKLQTGVYTVFFTTPMDNINYVFSGLGEGNGYSSAYVAYRNDYQVKALDRVNVTSVGNDNIYYNNRDVMVAFHGGKNY